MYKIFLLSILYCFIMIHLPGCKDDKKIIPPVRSGKKVIANWDVVPYQVISGNSFKAGVVAFYESGVDVVFKINRGSEQRVNNPLYNDQSDVWEYYIEINPSIYSDGPITISATAFSDDKKGDPRALPDLILNVKNTPGVPKERYVSTAGIDFPACGSTVQPCKTIEYAFKSVGEGGTVFLQAGTHELTSIMEEVSYKKWTTIKRAPGVTKDQVKIRAGGNYSRLTGDFIKYDGVTFFKDTPDQSSATPPQYSNMLYIADLYVWFNDCEFYDVYGRTNHESFTINGGQNPHYYMTNCYIHDVYVADGWWMRNCTIRNVGCDVWRPFDNAFFVNILIDNMDPALHPNPAYNAHSDLIQWYNPGRAVDNIILYNVTAMNMKSQGIMSGDNSTATNTAFVNLLMLASPDIGYSTSQITQFDHLIMWHCTTNIIPILIRDVSLNSNFDIRNNIFYTLSMEGEQNASRIFNSIIDHNHYYQLAWNQTTGIGTNATVGDPDYVNELIEPEGFHLNITSPAYKKGIPLECVPADRNGVLFDVNNPSMGAYSN